MSRNDYDKDIAKEKHPRTDGIEAFSCAADSPSLQSCSIYATMDTVINKENREILMCGQCSPYHGSQNKNLKHLAQAAWFTSVCPHCIVDFSGPINNSIEYLRNVKDYTKNIFEKKPVIISQPALSIINMSTTAPTFCALSANIQVKKPIKNKTNLVWSPDIPLNRKNNKKKQEAFSTKSDCGISSLDQHPNSAAPEKAESTDKLNKIYLDKYNSISIAVETEDNLMNDHKAANVVIKTQSHSLIARKPFLETNNTIINNSNHTLGNTIQENISLKKKETWDEAVIPIINIQAQINQTESSIANLANPKNIETQSTATSKIAIPVSTASH